MELLPRFLSTAFLLGYLVISASAMPLGKMRCNLRMQYPVQNNSKIIHCVPCPTCIAGLEPSVPCGTTVDNDAVLGPCQPCKDGTFSSNTDRKSCQVCQVPQCLKHEIVQQNCTETYDASHCTGHCQDGYVMNKEKSECKAHIEKKPFPTSNTTRVLPKAVEEHNEMAVWLIVVIVVVVVLSSFVFGIIAFKGAQRWKRREKKANDGGKYPLPAENVEHFDDDNGSSSSTELLNGNRECARQAMSTVGCSSNTSDSPNSGHGQLILDFQGTTSKPAQLTSPASSLATARRMPTVRQTAPVLNPSGSADVAADRNNAQPLVQNRVPDMLRFEDWPKKAYDEICREIENSVAPGRDWDALVGNLGFTVKAARELEKKKNKTDALIRSWMMKTENTVPVFIDVLNEMHMTVLADYINDNMNTLING